MATCPHCKGHLTEGHRCPRHRGYVVAEIIASALVGGVVSWLLLRAFDQYDQMADLETIAFVAGAVAGVVINRFLRA
jgi:hypothetical protein